MKIKTITRTGSTNTYLKEHPDEVGPMTLFMALEQDAGRGQRGNSWEAEPGKNITASFFFAPERIAPAEQFAISEATALAVVDTLRRFGIAAQVKWPNDIYVGDRKIAGILIENSIVAGTGGSGARISRSIVGIGLNVNQQRFLSDAPNPVSMANLTADTIFDLGEVSAELCDNLERRISEAETDRSALHNHYMAALWRGDSRSYPFRDTATGEEFSATISEVELTGHLILHTSDGTRRYAFKEVAFL